MDGQSTVVPDTASAEANVQADQVIFTSVRSRTGEGYRIIAASVGATAEEKKEITQRAPSHASLCDDGPTAVGLSCWRLSSGRHCLAHSRYAGLEHTARGGWRVYTRILLMDEPSYALFDCNPLRVHAALADAVPDTPLLKPPDRLDSLSLTASPQVEEDEIPLPQILQIPDATDLIDRLVASLLEGRQLIVAGAPAPFDLLEWTLMQLPLPARQHVSASVGLKFSRSRDFQLTLIDRDGGETQRAVRGEDIQCFDVESARANEHAPLEPSSR